MILHPRAQGIDVSAIGQGHFDWETWEGHIDFAIIKATEDFHFVDPQFSRNWTIAREMGIERLAYHYGHPDTDPSKQARLFTDVLKAHGDENVGMVLDIENADGMKPAHVAFWCKVFELECDRMTPGRKPKRAVITYTFPEFALEGNVAMQGDSPLWIAQPDKPEPEVPRPWHHWAFWQYAYGSKGGPNRNVFNGTVQDLHKFLRG